MLIFLCFLYQQSKHCPVSWSWFRRWMNLLPSKRLSIWLPTCVSLLQLPASSRRGVFHGASEKRRQGSPSGFLPRAECECKYTITHVHNPFGFWLDVLSLSFCRGRSRFQWRSLSPSSSTSRVNPLCSRCLATTSSILCIFTARSSSGLFLFTLISYYLLQ